MQFIIPKYKNKQKTEWLISEHSRMIVKYYAEFTGYSEDKIVDAFLKNILDDKDFIEWANKKRNNKRIITKLFPETAVVEENIG